MRLCVYCLSCREVLLWTLIANGILLQQALKEYAYLYIIYRIYIYRIRAYLLIKKDEIVDMILSAFAGKERTLQH